MNRRRPEVARLQELHKHAIQEFNEGNFQSALDYATKIKNIGQSPEISLIAGGHFIDIGGALNDDALIREGISLIKQDFLRGESQNLENSSKAYYYIANGYLALFDFKKIEDPSAGFLVQKELTLAKNWLHKSLKLVSDDDAELKSRILVNLGNCYDTIGRFFDGLECYEDALQVKPDFGMALGNKGIALLHFAALSEKYQTRFIHEAHSCLKEALKVGVLPEASASFETNLQLIEKKLPASALNTPLKLDGCKIRTKLKLERFIIKSTLKHRLYLNPCALCQHCDAAIGDTMTIPRMTVPAGSPDFLTLTSFLNQIKMDFMTFRFLFLLSQYEKSNLVFLNKRMYIADTWDQSEHNINIQLLKTSFKGFYDIMDKIAYSLNFYLRLGIPERRINFHRLWYTRDRNIRKKLIATDNLSLNALYDIHKDFDVGSCNPLRITRNALTHKFVNIRTGADWKEDKEDEKNMRKETLLKQTLELARIVRNSIIYMLYFIYQEERKKQERGKSPPLKISVKVSADAC